MALRILNWIGKILNTIGKILNRIENLNTIGKNLNRIENSQPHWKIKTGFCQTFF